MPQRELANTHALRGGGGGGGWTGNGGPLLDPSVPEGKDEDSQKERDPPPPQPNIEQCSFNFISL